MKTRIQQERHRRKSLLQSNRSSQQSRLRACQSFGFLYHKEEIHTHFLSASRISRSVVFARNHRYLAWHKLDCPLFCRKAPPQVINAIYLLRFAGDFYPPTGRFVCRWILIECRAGCACAKKTHILSWLRKYTAQCGECFMNNIHYTHSPTDFHNLWANGLQRGWTNVYLLETHLFRMCGVYVNSVQGCVSAKKAEIRLVHGRHILKRTSGCKSNYLKYRLYLKCIIVYGQVLTLAFRHSNNATKNIFWKYRAQKYL